MPEDVEMSKTFYDRNESESWEVHLIIDNYRGEQTLYVVRAKYPLRGYANRVGYTYRIEKVGRFWYAGYHKWCDGWAAPPCRGMSDAVPMAEKRIRKAEALRLIDLARSKMYKVADRTEEVKALAQEIINEILALVRQG